MRHATRCLLFALLALAIIGCDDEDPDVMPPEAVTDLEIAASTPDSLTLTWTAPGDDDAAGRSHRYDLRYSVNRMDESTWSEATPLDTVLTPRPAGETEVLQVGSVEDPHAYYFALRAVDEAGNWSGVSNVVPERTDVEPPNPVTDLAVISKATNSVTLTWTAPRDDTNKRVTATYDLRYATFFIEESNWGTATKVEGVPLPGTPTSRETVEITLTEPAEYFFAIKTVDKAGRWSDLSNLTWTVAGGDIILTYAGTGVSGIALNGTPLTAARLNTPMDVAFGPDGVPYLVDWGNHRILRVRVGRTYTLIGTGEPGPASEGPILAAVSFPTNLSFDDQGRIFLSAWHNSKIMRCDLGTELMERIAGLESMDPAGNRCFNGDGNVGRESCLDMPVATALDSEGFLYISDMHNWRIRRLRPVDGQIVGDQSIMETVVGTGNPGVDGRGGYNGNDRPGAETDLSAPGEQSSPPSNRLVVHDDEVYFCDSESHIVRKLDRNGVVRLVAGSGDGIDTDSGRPRSGYSGDGGPAVAATLHFPTDLAFDSEGNLYIADCFNSSIRKVDPQGIITTFAGRGERNTDPRVPIGDGEPAVFAWLDRPYGVAVDAEDNVYIADTHHHRIRVVYR